jgi:hypothetical protein
VNEVLAKLSSCETGAEQKRFENLQCVSKFIKTVKISYNNNINVMFANIVPADAASALP